MKIIFKKVKTKLNRFILPVLLFISAFSINFYRGAEITGGEDFFQSTDALKFVRSLSPAYLMHSHHDSIEFLTLPLYFLLGFNLSTLRLSQSIFLAGSVVLFYFFSKNHFDEPKKALLATLLLISFPRFILHKYHAEYSFLLFFAVGCLLFYSLIMKKKNNNKYIFLLGLFIGIGTYRKIIFAAFGFLLILSHILLYPHHFKEKLLSTKKTIIFIGATALGALPLIIWELYMIFYAEYHGNLERTLNLFSEGSHRSLFSGLLKRAIHVKEIFTEIFESYNYDGDLFKIVGFVTLFLFLSSVIYLLLKKDRKSGTFIVFTLLYIIVSTFELQLMIIVHLYVLMPIFIIIITTGIFKFFEDIFKNKKRALLISSFLIIIIVISNFAVIFSVLRKDSLEGRYDLVYDIGYTLKEGDFDMIYGFIDHVACDICGIPYISYYFITGGVPYCNASKTVTGNAYSENFMISCQDPDKKKWEGKKESFEKVINASKSTNNVYIDLEIVDFDKAVIHHQEDQDIFFSERVIYADEIDKLISENGYKGIRIDHPERGKAYHVWIHEEKEEVVNALQKIK